jgi:hypothetical protein
VNASTVLPAVPATTESYCPESDTMAARVTNDYKLVKRWLPETRLNPASAGNHSPSSQLNPRDLLSLLLL